MAASRWVIDTATTHIVSARMGCAVCPRRMQGKSHSVLGRTRVQDIGPDKLLPPNDDAYHDLGTHYDEGSSHGDFR